MHSVPLFILLVALASSAVAVTNLEVSTALKSFNENLEIQTSRLLNQSAQIEKLNNELVKLRDAVAENTKFTCDVESCPKKNVPAPIPVPGAACPWSNETTAHAELVWNVNLCGRYDEARRGNLTCFMIRHNLNDMKTCLQSLRQAGRDGPRGCFNEVFGSCSCALDTTLESRDYNTAFDEAYDSLNRYTAFFRADWGSWNGGPLRTPDGIEYPKYLMKLRYQCKL